MNTKLLGAAVTAALLGLSATAFGQTPSTGTSPKDASNGGPDTAVTGSGRAATGADSTVTTPAPTASRCDSMTGGAKTRCQRDERASGGSSSTATPVTKLPDQSGPGAVDKTEKMGKPGGGTSSAGN